MVKNLLQASVLFGEAKARDLGGRVFKEAFNVSTRERAL